MSDHDDACQPSDKNITILMNFAHCATHESVKIQGVAMELDGLSPEQVVPDLLGVIENLIAVHYASKPDSALHELIEAKYEDGPLDATERQRLANMVAHQLLLQTVSKHAYAKSARFELMDPSDI
jgi:hypothetical protein